MEPAVNEQDLSVGFDYQIDVINLLGGVWSQFGMFNHRSCCTLLAA